MKRILLIIPELSLGGTERQVLILARELKSRGRRVRLLALRRARRPFPFDRDIDTVETNTCGLSPLSFFVVLRQVMAFRPDVVHTFLFGFDLFTNLAARLLRVPCVVSSRRQLATWRTRRHLLIQNLANLLVHAVTTNSLAAADYCCCKERFLHRAMIHTIPNACRPRNEGPDGALPDKGIFCIVNTGNFWAGKGQETLVRAFADARGTMEGARLWLVGEGPHRDNAARLAADLGIAEAVSFLGERHDINAVLRQADLYVHGAAMESSPNAVLEAMGAGVPVVAPACGGLSELLDGGRLGLLCGTPSRESLSEAMHCAWSDREGLRERAARAKESALTLHAPHAVAEQHDRLYTRLVATRSAQPGCAARRLTLFTIGGMRSPSSRYRVLQFVPALRNAGYDVLPLGLPDPCGGRLCRAVTLLRHAATRTRQLRRADASGLCIIQKGLTPCRWRGPLALLRRLRLHYLFDLDDAVDSVLPIRFRPPFARRQDAGEPAALMAGATHVIAGNACLAEHAGRGDACTSVIPTVVDLHRYPDVAWRAPFRTDGRMLLVWTGQRSTLPYLLERLPVLCEAARRAEGRQITLRLLCDTLPTREEMGDTGPLRIEPLEWAIEREVELLADADVGLMPLPDNAWTRGKCGFKALQYMALGIPALCSPVGANRDIVQDGVSGFLAHTEREWLDRLAQLCSDPELRCRLGRGARARVRQHYALETAAPVLVKLIEAHCGEGRTDE